MEKKNRFKYGARNMQILSFFLTEEDLLLLESSSRSAQGTTDPFLAKETSRSYSKILIPLKDVSWAFVPRVKL